MNKNKKKKMTRFQFEKKYPQAKTFLGLSVLKKDRIDKFAQIGKALFTGKSWQAVNKNIKDKMGTWKGEANGS